MQLCTHPYLNPMMAAHGQQPLDLLSPTYNPLSHLKTALSPSKTSGLLSSAPVRRYKQYSEDSLQAALKEIMNGQSINRSSMKHSIPARTLRDWMKRLNIKSVFTHHSHNKERSTSQDVMEDESISSESPEPVQLSLSSPVFHPSNAMFTNANIVFPGIKMKDEEEIDDDEDRTLKIDESPMAAMTQAQIAQTAN
jgi:hypothetical protein